MKKHEHLSVDCDIPREIPNREIPNTNKVLRSEECFRSQVEVDEERFEDEDVRTLDSEAESPGVVIENRQLQTAPDKGWSWFVALASHMTCLIVGGLVYTGGVFLSDLEQEFDKPKSTVSLAQSCQNGMYQMSGALASVLINRFGTRPVIVMGTLTSATALIVASWSPSIALLIATYGVLCGVGLGMMYLVGIVAVSTYFHRKRTLATGLATCGSGVGMFLFAPMTEALVQQYGWRGALIVLGGVTLHGLVAAALVRPLDKTCSRDSVRPISRGSRLTTDTGLKGGRSSLTYDSESDSRPNHGGAYDSLFTETSLLAPTNDDLKEIGSEDYDIRCKSISKNGEIQPTETSLKLFVAKKMNSSDADACSTPEDKHFCDVKRNIRSDIHRGPGTSDRQPQELSRCSVTHVDNDSLQQRSSQNSSLINRSNGKETASQSMNPLEERRPGQWRLFVNSLNLSVLKSVQFRFVLLGNFCSSLGMIVPLVYIAEMAKHSGVEETDAAWLLSIIGISNTVGRFLSGLVTHMFSLNSILLTAVALHVCGLVTALYPLAQGYFPLAIMSAVFGLCMAVKITLCSVLLCDTLGTANLASSFGYVGLIRGVASISGPSLAGAIIDATGAFDPAFYLGGGMILLGGVCHLLLYLLHFTPCRENKSIKDGIKAGSTYIGQDKPSGSTQVKISLVARHRST